jgi:sugar lactone lactonase YvrE
MFLYAVSPGGEALAVWDGAGAQLHPGDMAGGGAAASRAAALGDVSVYSRDGSTRTLVCTGCATAGGQDRGITPPLVSWSPDGAFVYFVSMPARTQTAVPLQPGRHLPDLPPSGLSSMAAAGELPGAQAISAERAFVGANPSTYSFVRVTTHRNIYRISIPD